MTILDKIKSWIFPENDNGTTGNNFNQQNSYVSEIIDGVFDGQTFPGSLNTAQINWTDYYTLRARSAQLFQENPYCKGVIRRLLTNEIHTGLNLEAHPVQSLINLTDDDAMKWSDDREIDWKLWGNDAEQCDWEKRRTLGELALECRQTALIEGDCLEVFRVNPKTGLPAIELIGGRHIKTPFGKKPRPGNKIVHGVELDSNNRHVAYWVQVIKENSDYLELSDKDLEYRRIPVRGEKSGRLIAKLIYGTEKTKMDDVRGEPILANMLYMIGELKKGMDSEQRGFTINSMLAYFIENEGTGIPTSPVTGGATRKGSIDVTQPDGSTKAWNYARNVPGMVFQKLGRGEKPVPFNHQRPNSGVGKFEEIIVNTFAWSLEIPPEIVRLLFQSNFSASRQANNEFENYLSKRCWKFGLEFYQPAYELHTLLSALNGRIQAPGLLEAWRNPKERNIYNAWMYSEWKGLVRHSVDIKKDVDAMAKALDYGMVTGDYASRKISGQGYFENHKQRKREIEYDKKNGLSFSSEENQNKEPIPEQGADTGTEQSQSNWVNGVQLTENQKKMIAQMQHQNNDIAQARIRKLEKIVMELSNAMEELQEKQEEMEAVNV